MTREERIKARQERWQLPKADGPVASPSQERIKNLAKLATSEGWPALRDILDEAARYRVIGLDQQNWALLTAAEQAQASLARRLITIIEEAPDRYQKMQETPEPVTGVA